MTNEMQQWIEQAKAAIKQGQGENDFVAHCHPDNRATARRAYNKALSALDSATPPLASLLREALELIQEDIDNRDGRDNFGMSCGNCDGALPIKHSFGCRAKTAIANAAKHGSVLSFWVVERFDGGQSAGYWDGANSRSFQHDIDKAIQFRRQQDAFWATRGWHWADAQITEHCYL